MFEAPRSSLSSCGPHLSGGRSREGGLACDIVDQSRRRSICIRLDQTQTLDRGNGRNPRDGSNGADGKDKPARWRESGADFADVVMRFLEDGEGRPESFSKDGDLEVEAEEEGVAERKVFWDTQHQLLKGVLCRSSLLESRIRNDTKRLLKELRTEGGPKCACGKEGWCRNCLLRDVTDRLRKAGHDSAICKSKWMSSPDIPSGEHRYMDVVATSSSSGNEAVRVLIELDFRSEFEMARGSAEYNRLVQRLPDVFVGKAERLQILIKILCDAAKRCMKENKMHMGPWRKHKYMLAKWLGTCHRTTPAPDPPISVVGVSDRHPKLRASMLTHNLLGNLPAMHCPPVEVV